MICIYCKQEIRHSSEEHIIPYALGGRYSSKRIVCKACNERKDVKTQIFETRKIIIRPLNFKPKVADFGFDEHYRAIAKVAFEYLATKLEPEDILAPEFDVIREFIIRGTLKSDDYLKLFLADYRNIYTVCQPQEQWFHRVSIYCNRNTHNVIGLVELFSYVRIAVVLSWQYEGRTQGYCLIEYPLAKRWEEQELKCFDPILTEMITQIHQEQFAKSRKAFQECIQVFATELEDYHTRQHMQEVFNEYFAEPLLLTVDDLNILIPRLVSYYAYRSNLSAFQRLMEKKDVAHFIEALLSAQAEKTGIMRVSVAEQKGYIEVVQKTACLQMLIEVLSRLASIKKI